MKFHMLKVLLLLSLIANGVFLYGHIRVSKEVSVEEKEQQQNEEKVTAKESTIYESGMTYPLMRIVDGDTIVVGFNGQTQYVRLIGIDSPEPNDPGGPQCYAQESTVHLQEIARTGLVTLFFDESQGMRDSYGRLLAYAELPDGTDIGKKMVEDGYAHEFTYHGPYERQADYMGAEKLAMEEEKGLWSKDACSQQ